jgi:Tfp pilus assembly protein PilF
MILAASLNGRMPRALPATRVLVSLCLTVLLAGCVTTLAPPPVSDNNAVVALVDGARADATAGKFGTAAASIERALRIEPRNAYLWHELAQIHFQQGDWAQTESHAARSNSFAGGNKLLRAANWRLIAEARAGRGDDAGARVARDRAGEQER